MKKEVLLLIQAKLDEARSKGLINSGISGLQKVIGRLRIQAEIGTASLKQSEKSMRGIISNLGNGIKSQLSQIPQAFQQHFSIANGVNALISQTRKSMAELREVNTILTEIGKTSSLTQGQLKAVGDASFEAANKYGSSASGYLYSVQEMYRAGYQNAGQMADLSALAQSAGGLDAGTWPPTTLSPATPPTNMPATRRTSSPRSSALASPQQGSPGKPWPAP